MVNMSIINTLLNAVVESAPQPEIITPHFNLLSQFHLLIAMPFSTGKSTITKALPNAKISLNYTLPSIVGTVTKEGDFVNSALKESVNGVFVMDEAHRLSPKSVDAMLSFLEQGYYSRNLGFKIKDAGKEFGEEGTGFHVKIEENGFKIWVRFSCLWLGERIYDFHKKAFLSRFFPLSILPTRDNIKTFMYGDSFLDFKQRKKFKVFKKSCRMNKKVHDYLTTKWIEISDKFNFPQYDLGYLVRGKGQMIKLSAHFCRLRGKVNIIQKDCDKALKFAEICLMNYKLVQLTPLEIKVFSLVKCLGMGILETAKALNVTAPVVSEYVRKIDDKMR